MFEEPRNALERLCRERGVDFATLSRYVGRNPAYIQQFIRRGTPKRLPEEERRLIARFLDVDEGMLGGQPSPSALGLVAVPQRRVRAAAGNGQLVHGEEADNYFGFDRRWLRRLTASTPEKLSILRVEGDSMAPTLANGDEILVDEADGALRLRDGVYVLRVDDALVVKRLAIHPMGRKATIQSDNPSYADWPDVPLTDIDCIGRVIWTGRRLP